MSRPDSPELATNLDNLAVVLAKQDKYKEAEPLYQRSLEIRDMVDISSLHNLALVKAGLKKYRAADALYKRILAIAPNSPGLVPVLNEYAEVLHAMNREAEAARVEARAKSLKRAETSDTMKKDVH